MLKPVLDQLKALFRWPQKDPLDYPFVPSDVAQLHRVASAPGVATLDEQTWNDLLLPRYLEQLSPAVSIFGRQVLYQRLRNGMDDQACGALGERVETLRQDPVALAALGSAMRPLRDVDAEVAALLYEGERPQLPRWARHTWLLPLALALSLAAVLLSQLAWLGVGVALYLLMSVQVRYYDRLGTWQRSVHALQLLLRVCGSMEPAPHPLQRQISADSRQALMLNHSLSNASKISTMPGMGEYADWFMLANVKHYFKTVDVVFAQRDFLRECYQRCANLEADAALARHLLAAPTWCRVRRASGAALVLEGGVHPLIEDPAPLSVALQGKGAFISGQNAVGKSTFLRMLGLNLVVARAFGFCYARHAVLPALPVYASMQGEDSMLDGESLYMAELRRARELLAAADGQDPGVYIIDEIFRGTNHLESVSAAAAVIDALAAKGLVIVSSHNLVLAPLLAHRLDAFAIGRDAKGGLALASGVLSETNGLTLLGAQGFDVQVQDSAGKVSRWLSGYLAHPAGQVGVLVEAGDEVAESCPQGR